MDLFLLNSFFPAVRYVGLKLSLELTFLFWWDFLLLLLLFVCFLILFILKEVPFFKIFFLYFFPTVHLQGGF